MTEQRQKEFDDKYGSFEFAPQINKPSYDNLKAWIDQNFIDKDELRKEIEKLMFTKEEIKAAGYKWKGSWRGRHNESLNYVLNLLNN